MKKISCISLFIFMITSQAIASVKVLATIHRNSDKVKSELILVTDQQEDISHVLFKIYEEDGSLDRTIKVSPKELQKGKVVISKMGVDVITLQSDNLALHNGGDVNIKYLTKFKLLGKDKFSKFTVLLDRLGDNWELSKGGKVFKSLMTHVHSKGISKFEIIK